ncbi:glycosyltransferase [Prosthecobacter sp.]|uniref:glycosyltransferase n=1 Tax=Prosthecobacter sp. TaxID=1965333 RepID=UPI00248A64F2|nr:glycosyltransferase [Prosthecobacter sp.]MDI1311029.1 glycosyltransferase [Prosthecobacter sp.]
MRPRLLLIGHTYAALENRKKLQALAAHFELVCVTSTTEQHLVLGRPSSEFDNDSDAPTRSYQLIRLPRSGQTSTTFHYIGLTAVMRSCSFDVVLVENEPWARVCWQARVLKALFQAHALFGEFTWENIERPGWKGALLAPIYRAMTATTDFIIAGNQAAAQLVQRCGAHAGNVLVAPQLGVDLDNHLPASSAERTMLRQACGLPADAFIVGYCGRLTEEKGLHELLQACEALQNVHLAILGSGRLDSWLKEQQDTRPWLHLLPTRPHFEIPSFLRCLNVFVLASKPVRTMQLCWEEQFGHVLIEAMACGVATLGSSSGAIPEVIGHEKAVFPHGDATALASCIRDVMNNSTIVQSQLDRTRRLYTHDAVAKQWAAFIHHHLAAPAHVSEAHQRP